ncbi:endo alpha-1,4 polygalactosaminidase [Flavobacterium sp. XS1P32]|uniref:endo alpha-1,4 polygalactosaminidase n=1 Tax=Flavobacterium sp. XS1P32 TaxID=3401726 RepID=UPI003AAFF6A3
MKFKTFILATLIFSFSSCSKDDNNLDNETEFKQKMREFVIGISQYSKAIKPNFLIVPQNGIELVSSNGQISGQPHTDYLKAIDANGQEDLFYGYDNDDQATSSIDNNYLRELLNISKNAGKTILVTDYCSTQSKMTNSYLENFNAGYISFSANQRELTNIPFFPNPLYQENNVVVNNLSQVKNFLYLINPTNFTSKSEFITAVTSTNYDLLIMDLFFKDNTQFTSSEITQLKNKANGGKRLILSYMSIGEAENYRYYWQPRWNTYKPSWLDTENPNWAGNYKVKYWNTEWQNIIYGNNNSYLKKIIDSNFDGVYLDIIDAFEYYEQ